jgi:hypothetical protein
MFAGPVSLSVAAFSVAILQAALRVGHALIGEVPILADTEPGGFR